MELPDNDIYKTIETPAEASIRERSSKFLAYAYPVTDAEQAREYLDALRKEYYDATHHCYAYRIGPQGEEYRANDDGEPSGTAGKPILGQMMSREVTDCLIVVVRYFGGTKLGVTGLIGAYREAAAMVLEESTIIEKTVDTIFRAGFPYINMNDVMKVVKEEQPRIISQDFDNLCVITMAIRRGRAGVLEKKLRNIEGVELELRQGV